MTMTTLTRTATVFGGVDTHADTHVAAAIDPIGRLLGTAEFATTPTGHRELLCWLRNHGDVETVGVEGTGAWGAGLARFLARAGVAVVEVDRPNRQHRRRHGKSDPVDAEAAARAALSGDACGVPKSRSGAVESIRALRVARRSALKARTQAGNQLHALVVTAPYKLRERLRGLPTRRLALHTTRLRPGDPATPTGGTKTSLRSIGRRWIALDTEIQELSDLLDTLVADTAPDLIARHGVGTETAAALLIAAGDNPHRLHSEASFAALCGTSPIDASSGRNQRHRLNRGGNRDANNALWWITIVRMRSCDRTKAYVAKRTSEGLTKKEIIRCLKRYIARELYPDLQRINQ
jgi:transposase